MALDPGTGVPIADPERQHKINRLLVENSLGLMCIHDLEGVVEAINPAVAESLGYRLEHERGRNLRDFLIPEARPLFDSYLARLKRNGTDSGLMRLSAQDGTERIWMYRNTVYEEPGAAPIVLGHALDITERARAEQSLKEAKTALADANAQLALRVQERTAELEHANEQLRAEMAQRKRMEEELLQARKLESLGVLAGGIAHDFNNFLTVVQGNVELARLDRSINEELRDILDQTMKACHRAAQLSSQLLIFARGGAPVRRVVSVSNVLLEAVNLARAGSPVSTELKIAPDLYPAEIDVGQMGQVLHNILLNAKQAMPNGGLIEIAADNVRTGGAGLEPARKWVRISVRDYGYGIAADDLPRVFDPYFSTKPSGSGLGLATAYAIVGKHGGRLSVTSTAGEGAVFTIDLPASGKLPEAPPAVTESPQRGSGKLLVMDDEAGLRNLIKRVLTDLGYQVACASDGAEAIALYRAAKASGQGFDAVLLDLTVAGGMGGLEAAARLREIDGRAKLIVSSGYSAGAVMARFDQHGFDDVIPKPWTPAELAEVFRRTLAARRL